LCIFLSFYSSDSASMGISINKAVFIALFLETLFFGILLTVASITMLILLSRTENTRTNKYLRVVLCLMVLTATAHIIIDFVRVLKAFLIQSGPSGANDYLKNLMNPLFLGKNALLHLQITLGDCVNIWRCYVMFNKRILPVAPAMLVTVVSVVCACLILETLARSTPGSTIFGAATDWITTYFVLTMVVNVYCTAMIVWRIYAIGRSHSGFKFRNHVPVIMVIVESGSLYTCSIIAFLCAFLSGSNGQYTALDLVTPLVGIIFCLIILQIWFHRKTSPSGHRGEVRREDWNSMPHYAFTDRRDTPSTSFPISRLAIDITTQVEECYPRETDSEGRDVAKVANLGV